MQRKIKRAFASPNYVSGKLAKNLGGMLGNRSYKKFIVLARSRTGSTMLIDMLNSHPAVYAESELFSRLGDRSVPDVLDSIFCKYLPYIQAVGFKIFYYHPHDDASGLIWERLGALDDLAVIHLKRRNILRAIVSQKIAAATGVWQATAPNAPTGDKRVQLPAAELQADFEQTRQWEEQFEERFRTQPLLNLHYEDMIANPQAEYRKVIELLALDYHAPKVALVRQNPEPLPALVKNYTELKSHFANTRWSDFFDA